MNLIWHIIEWDHEVRKGDGSSLAFALDVDRERGQLEERDVSLLDRAFWAIDWDNKSDTFHNQWQSYRTRQDADIQLSAFHDYEQAGAYTVVVKVIDILGNDTTKTLTLDIPARAS